MNGYKIWDLVPDASLLGGYLDSPAGLNYKTGLKVRLHPKLTFEKGELVSCDYYLGYDGAEYSNLIVSVAMQWVRNDSGRLTQRVTTRKWTLETGEFGPDEKVTIKFYDAKKAAIADTRRRRNIIESMTAQSESFGVLPYVQTMFRSLDDELNAFEKTGDTKLIQKIAAYQPDAVWLAAEVAPNVTLRMAILGQLTL
jgi:hypothetical protein